jgi:putative heme iron utilization protein
MNADHSDAVARYAAQAGARPSAWTLSSIDPEGLDLISGDEVVRLWFDVPLRSADELRPVLVTLAKKS